MQATQEQMVDFANLLVPPGFHWIHMQETLEHMVDFLSMVLY